MAGISASGKSVGAKLSLLTSRRVMHFADKFFNDMDRHLGNLNDAASGFYGLYQALKGDEK